MITQQAWLHPVRFLRIPAYSTLHLSDAHDGVDQSGGRACWAWK